MTRCQDAARQFIPASSRHLVKADALASADPAQVIRLLRPCMLSLAASPDHGGPS